MRPSRRNEELTGGERSAYLRAASSADRREVREQVAGSAEGKEEKAGRGMGVKAPVIGKGCCLVSGRRLRNLGEGSGPGEESSVWGS